MLKNAFFVIFLSFIAELAVKIGNTGKNVSGGISKVGNRAGNVSGGISKVGNRAGNVSGGISKVGNEI